MSIISLDPQIHGRDNGTEGGVVDTFPVSGDFTLRPIMEGQYLGLATGTGSASIQGETSQYNPAHSNTSLFVSVPHGLGNSADIRIPFFGTKVGVSFFRASTAAGLGNFAALVDGIGYPLYPALVYEDSQGYVGSTYDSLGYFYIAKDLPLGTHELALKFYPDATLDWTWNLYGLLVDKQAGYLEARPAIIADLITAVPSTAAAIRQQPWMRGITAVHYYNPTGNTRTVTITWKGTVIDVLTLATLTTAYWPRWGAFPLPWATARAGSANLTHTCDAASAVVATVFGEAY